MIGNVRGKDVLLVDDMVDTGGSVIAAIEELKNHGDNDITVVCAHPLMNGEARTKLDLIFQKALENNWKFQMVGTKVVEHLNPPTWYLSFPIEKLIARAVEKINSRGSVTKVQNNLSLNSNS